MACTVSSPHDNKNIFRYRSSLILSTLFLFILSAFQPVFANKSSSQIDLSDPYRNQRNLFLKAEKAFKNRQYSRYKKYYAKLDNYPLQAYLKYNEYRKKLSGLSEQQVLQFFKDYSDTPYEGRLRTAWLDKMAKKGQWQKYLNAYTPQKSTSRQCHYLNALIKANKAAQAFAQVPELWLKGKSQPRACDPVFSTFKKAGKMTPELLWGRIKLAMQKGRTSLATYLAKSLNKKEQKLVAEWIKIYRKPGIVLSSPLLKKTHPLKSTIQVHSVERMTQRKAEAGIKLLADLSKDNHFSLQEQDKMYRAIGMKLAYHHGKDAWYWLNKISDENSDKTVRQWRARSAIREENWPAITSSIKRMPEEEQKDFRWQYWLASGKEQQGNKKAAQKDFYQLAQNRSDYGFLAADKMAMPYEFQNAPLSPDSQALKTVAQHPGILRAREF